MTKKRILQSLVAASVMTSVAFAGTVSSTSVGLISSELLSFSDANLTQPLSTTEANVAYTPSKIPAGSLKNPIFKFVFDNASDLQVGDVKVYEVVDGNESNTTVGNLALVGNTPTQSNDANNPNAKVLSFNASSGDIYVYNSKKYVIRDSNATGNTDLNITVKQGTTSPVTIAAYLYSGDSQAQNDDAPASTLATVGEEITATVSKKLNARIDAANSFFTFFDQFDTSNTQDDLEISVTQNPTIAGGGLDTPQINIVTYSDQNLTKNGYVISAFPSAPTVNDTNVTFAQYLVTAGTNAETITYDVDGLSKIEKTNFGADLWITATGTTSKFTKINKTENNAGAWTIYGYSAQIPNVISNDTFLTNFKFTNRSSLDADIYFTLIDRDGTIVTLNSVNNPELADLKAGSTGWYTASDLVTLAASATPVETATSTAGFDGTQAFSVEVNIPTTPTSVYGFASLKNITVGNFKDLPVYNSSTMSY